MGLFSRGSNKSANPEEIIEEVQGAYYKWVKLVEDSKGRTEDVVDLYTDDAILLPTLSPKICVNKEMITAYFQNFLSLKDLKVETEEIITRIHGDIAMNTGCYNFYHLNDKVRHILYVRFDFWYRKEGNEWKVIFHQSSLLPVATE